MSLYVIPICLGLGRTMTKCPLLEGKGSLLKGLKMKERSNQKGPLHSHEPTYRTMNREEKVKEALHNEKERRRAQTLDLVTPKGHKR